MKKLIITILLGFIFGSAMAGVTNNEPSMILYDAAGNEISRHRSIHKAQSVVSFLGAGKYTLVRPDVTFTKTDNIPPVADVDIEIDCTSGERCYLSHSGSHDPDGIIVRYEWTQLSGNPVEILYDDIKGQHYFIAPEIINEDLEV